MSTKTLDDASVKAVQTAIGAHELEFYALAFSKTPDKQGDVIDPGALDGWLARFYAAGKPLPISFHHAAMRGESAGDPFSVIGYAPADAEHVWLDEHGLRIRAFLETEINDKAEQVYRLAKRGLLTGASAVFTSEIATEKRQRDGSTRIMVIPEVREAGPTLTPANDDAVVLSVKAEEERRKWNGAAAMASCSSAADFRAIAFERSNDSDPDTAAHWALPHHTRPGASADPGGVSAALGALAGARGGAPDLKDASAARSHLEAHRASFGERAASVNTDTATITLPPEMWEDVRTKAGRKLSAANAGRVKQIRDLADELLALLEEVGDEEPEAKSAGPNDWVRERLAAFGE